MNYYIYLLFIVPIFLVFLIVLHFIHKKNEKKTAEAQNQSNESPSSVNRNGEVPGSGNKRPVDVYRLQEQLEKLKNENARLRKINKILETKTGELKTDIEKLEQANSVLEKQKEKVVVSKRNLEALLRRKEELFAIAVHDIKNPAGALKGYVDLLKSYDLNAIEQHELLEHVSNASIRIVEIAQKMSLVVAEEEEIEVLELKRSSVKKLIDRVVNDNLGYAQRKSVKLLNNSSPDLPEVLMDEFKIREALDNLINNAIKFAPAETIVQVKAFFSMDKVTIEVNDNGVGISNLDQSKMFQKGKTLSAKPTGGESSSGLGLWIVKSIIEEHGGQIEVQSKLGSGTKFSFYLPLE